MLFLGNIAKTRWLSIVRRLSSGFVHLAAPVHNDEFDVAWRETLSPGANVLIFLPGKEIKDLKLEKSHKATKMKREN